jgi:hypothetical protein
LSSRDARRTGLGLLAAVLLLAVGGCTDTAAGSAEDSSAAATTSVSDVAADDVTGRIAAVEFARQCTVTAQAFADESAITTDLDDRLTAAGLTHAQWKDWHDALAASPELLAQLAEVSAPGCAAA